MAGTLEQIEGEVWPEPDFHSHVVMTCHALRKKPIDQFTVEDLRIMIGQNIGVPHLFPYALTVLRDNPLAEGDFYGGDLLKSVLNSDFVRACNDSLVLQELEAPCSLALDEGLRKIDEEMSDTFFGRPPSDFGIDDAALADLRAKELQRFESKQPWTTVLEFMRERELPVDLSPT